MPGASDVAFVEHHAAGEDEVDQRLDVVGMIGGPERGMRHVAARDVDHLLVLDVESRLAVVLQRADVVEVGVRQDHIGLAGGIDADLRQGFARTADEVVGATHALGLALRHAGIDHPRPAGALQGVGEEVEALDHLVVIAAEKHVPLGPLVLLGVADGVDLVLGQLGHGRSPPGRRLRALIGAGGWDAADARPAEGDSLHACSGHRESEASAMQACTRGQRSGGRLSWTPRWPASLATWLVDETAPAGTPVRSRSRRFHEQRAD